MQYPRLASFSVPILLLLSGCPPDGAGDEATEATPAETIEEAAVAPAPPEAPEAPTCALASQLGAPCATGNAACVTQAREANDEGKRLWLQDKDLAAGSAQFARAFGMAPEAQYAFNLCYAQHQLGDLDCARWACDAVLSANPDDKLRQKAQLVLDDVSKRIP